MRNQLTLTLTVAACALLIVFVVQRIEEEG
jgi:hypothetical protein